MGTRFELQLRDVPGAPEAAHAAAARVAALEAVLSEWRPGSPLAEVNRLAGAEAVAVPADLRDVLKRGLELGAATDGAFDVTWAALWGLWDFRRGVIPDPAEIDRRLPLIDYRSVVVDGGAGTVSLPWPGQAIGLGGIAKGWALDAVAADLRRAGFQDFLLSAGGQVLAAGQPGTGPWRIGIRDPRGPPDDWFAAVSLVDGSISTSGDYERYFEASGIRYHHIIDPRSGRPARGLRSATIWCADATTADALSTAVFVLGVRDGLALVERWPGAEALLVDDEGGVHRSPGWSGLWFRHPPREASPEGAAEEHR